MNGMEHRWRVMVPDIPRANTVNATVIGFEFMDDELQDAIDWAHIPIMKSREICRQCEDQIDVIIGGLRYMPDDPKYLYRSFLLACRKCNIAYLILFLRESNN